MELVLASQNMKKIREIELILRPIIGDIKILSLADIGFRGEIDESGTTFEENAYIKASVPADLGYIGISDDSGLEVDVLNGRPGVYSSRYSGIKADDDDNNDKLLLELLHYPVEKRTARFVSVICCVFPDSDEYFTVRGTCEGVIIDNPRGDNGFGYDPLFYCTEFGKTFAELTDDEKNSISHRGKALTAFAQELKKYVKEKNI